MAVNVALLSGATMIYMNRFDPDAVIAAMPGATSLMGVPTFYTRLLDHPRLGRETCANMRLFVSGSAPLLAENSPRLEGADRVLHPRALRHDRNQHDHIEPL